MPLELDGQPRGRHALHVYQHGKLGRHMTLIKDSLPTINSFIDSKQVVEVDLGRIVVAKGASWKHIGIRCRQEQRLLHLTCTAERAMQFITVTFRVGVDLEEMIQRIHQEGFAFRVGA